MSNIIRLALACALVLLLAGALFLASFPLQWWNISIADLKAEYERPASQYVELDGVQLHFQDEGNPNGAPVVMLHGNFANLRTFDDWLPVLADDYRVIRFDSPLSGLSGPDPSGNYTIDRRVFLMEELLRHLEVEQYFLLATSFNAPTAFRVAARKPEKVLGLVLGNAGGLPRKADSNLNRPEPNLLKRWMQQYYFPRSFFEKALVRLLPDPARRTEDVIDQFHWMVTAKGRPQEGAQILRQFDSQNAESVLNQITVPVLLQWTTDGDQPLLVDKDLVRYQAWLNRTEVQTIEYDSVGHMLYQNAPEATAADARAFFDAVLAGEYGGNAHEPVNQE